MKKIILIAASLVSFTLAANAQSANTTQTVQLSLSNALEISFTGTNGGATVNMPFTTVADYASGIESGAQELKVRSNRNFKVDVKTASGTFTGGSGNMPVQGVLALAVTANTTGGTTNATFNNTYASLNAGNQDIIINGSKGGDQRFSVKYKATPGFAYPAGTYTVDVIYTATQQ